ncbi:alkaline phosphatase family protein [Arenibacter algicola]|uniref:alkaline phosphatase family protein n=1 Tax=Arenibacter algicola TaxID=616991 RepID=UPI001C077E66|nr:alkaline phosphatase family protein [Arenibacter algicola]MBU2903611.1 alkaline phosphatase family protein [Arenibacter algicola]
MKNIFLLLLFLFGNQYEGIASKKEYRNQPTITKKVLLIGIDGLQLEKLNALETPNFDVFNIEKAYGGGIVGTTSQQTTGSGPGWMTILTGVWNDKHGVISNDTVNKAKAKSIFQYLKEHNNNFQTTSIATWSPIHHFLDDKMMYVDRRFDGGTDYEATEKVVGELQNNNSDFLFVHYSEPDNIGHRYGYGNEYNQSIKEMDGYLGKIMKLVNNRSKEKNEQWLVILTTDHGRRGEGNHHGSQTVEEKTIFVGMNHSGNEEFNTIVPEVPIQDYNGIYQHMPQTSIVPTILTYFDIKIDARWQLASSSLIGEVGPRRVMVQPNNNTLWWYSKSLGYAKIYKNNILIDSVPAQKRTYKLNERQNKTSTYTIVINGQSGSAIRKNIQINVGMDWGNDEQVLIYNDKTYVRYLMGKNKAKDKNPKVMSNKDWHGVEAYAEKIEAAFRLDKEKMFLFLNDGRFILFNIQENRIEDGYPNEITNTTWPGLEPYKNGIVAAVKINDSVVYFFIRDGRYMVYNLKENKTETTYAQAINENTLPGLSAYAPKISAAINSSPRWFYVLLNDNTYLKYDKIKNKVLSAYPKPINNKNWPKNKRTN